MLRKKLILLGGKSVGKTSLVARWVKGIFSDRYIATIGVKIEKKTVKIPPEEVILQIWDLQGDIQVHGYFQEYIRGADACLFVVDATRRETLEYAIRTRKELDQLSGGIPFALALNKVDLIEGRKVSETDVGDLRADHWEVFNTSAKSGSGVEEVFEYLARRLVERSKEV